MAYDKVVDSSVLNNGLKAIADAIRDKAGTSDALAFPAGMAEAIAAIAAGGGAKVEVSTLTPASDITKSAPLTVNHTLGILPDFVCVFAHKHPTSGTSGVVSACMLFSPPFSPPNGGTVLGNSLYYAAAYMYSYSTRSVVSVSTSKDSSIEDFLKSKSVPVSAITAETITLCGINDAYGGKLLAGSTYTVIVGAIGYE